MESGSTRNVLLVIRWPVGGIRTFLKYVISEFPCESYRFWVISVSSEGMRVLKSDLGDRVDNWTSIPSDGNEGLNLAKAVWRVSRKYHFDVIHAHGFTSAIICLPSSLIGRSLLVCTAHDVLSDVQFSGPLGAVRKVILAAALSRCKLVHSVSKDAEENLLDYFPFLSRKSVTISNGINVNLFRCCQRADLHHEFGIDPSVKIIGFFGRFMSQKGFKYLVSAVGLMKGRLESPSIHVICFGSGAFIREEKNEIKRVGLESYFTFVPFTPDVSGAMKGCDVVAMPSLWEACPLQPMEALCAGVPFVGSNCVGLREVLEKTPAIQFVTGDVVGLANGILRSFEIGRGPFERFAPVAADRFDVRKTAVKIYELYEKVIV